MIVTLIVLSLLNKALNHRWDGNPAIPYYEPEELSIEEERFSFKDGKYLIDGSRYFLKDIKFKGIMCIFHGIGAGRNAYLKEIAFFAKAGYLVYAYDNLGSMRSEGKGIQGLGRVYKTQEKFFKWLDNDPKAQGLRRFSFGHSWGGYSAMLSMQNRYKIEKVVCLSGLLRPSNACYNTLIRRHLDILKLPIKLAIRILSGKNSDVDVRKIFKTSKAKLLYIVGENDKLVSKENNGNILFNEFNKTGRLIYKVIPGSGHNVNYELSAEKYLNGTFAKGIEKINSPIDLELDRDKATELNKEVMSLAVDFFEK